MNRLILDSDGHNFLLVCLCDDTREGIIKAISEQLVTIPREVSTYCLSPGCGTYYYPTKIGEIMGETECTAGMEHFRRALDKGLDPFGMWIDAINKSHMECFISFRMNDVHEPLAENGWNTPEFRLQHPDMTTNPAFTDACEPDWWIYGLDYTYAEVRDYYLSILEELIGMYEFDGILLDWMRWPRHLSGNQEEIWNKRGYITEFTAEARKLCRAHGRNIQLAARVPSSLQGCRNVGMDIAEWTKQGLVDFIVPASFLNTDFHIPISEFKKELGDYQVPVYANIEHNHASQVHIPESMRACAMCLYEDGADGIFMFNYPDWDLQHVALPPYYWLKDLGSYENTLQKPLLFSVEHAMFRVPDIELPYQLPVQICPGESKDIYMDLPAGAFPCVHSLALVDGGADVKLSINGTEAFHINNRYRQRRALFTAEVSECRQIPDYDDSDSQHRLFRVDHEILHPGKNTLRITNSTDRKVEINKINLGIW